MNRQRTSRLAVALALTLALAGSSACKTLKQPPVQQTTDQQQARLVEMNKLADFAEKTIDLARTLQDTEITVYNSKTVAGFDAAKHEAIQTGFKKLFDESATDMKVAKDVSTVDADRRKAVARIGDRITEFVGSIQINNPLLKATIGALLAAASMLNLTVI
jgi:hypothetical protein